MDKSNDFSTYETKQDEDKEENNNASFYDQQYPTSTRNGDYIDQAEAPQLNNSREGRKKSRKSLKVKQAEIQEDEEFIEEGDLDHENDELIENQDMDFSNNEANL